MISGVNGQNGVPRVCSANAGSKITFEYRFWPDGSQPGAIDKSHKGPCAVYMKKVDSAVNDQATGDGWFNIYKDNYDAAAGLWCTEKLIPNNGHLTVTIPSDLEGGYYLIRPELLALHQADKTPPDPQFYVGCAQVFLKSRGSAKPKDTVSIPGYVDMSLPAMTYSVWTVPLKPFTPIGPSTYTSSSKRDLSTRDSQSTQTEGLPPANCLIPNDNWCGTAIPAYSDEGSCWQVGIFLLQITVQNPTNMIYRLPKTVSRNSPNVTIQQDRQATRVVKNGNNTVETFKVDVNLATSRGHHPPLRTCLPNYSCSRTKSTKMLPVCWMAATT